MNEPNSKRESKKGLQKQREEEDINLLAKSENSSKKTESKMLMPKVNLSSTSHAHVNKYPPNDLDIIDPRLEKEYTNKEIYKEQGEAGCFKGCYTSCGDCCATSCVVCSICGCGPVKTINQGEIGLIIRYGKVHKKLPPGLHTINSCIDQVVVVDMRLNQIKSSQLFTTKDNLTIKLSSFGTWRVTHPEIFWFTLQSFNLLMVQLISGVLCTQASQKTLDQLMLERDSLED